MVASAQAVKGHFRALPEDLSARTLLHLEPEKISDLQERFPEKSHPIHLLIDRANCHLKADFRKEVRDVMQFAQSALTIPASAIAEVEKLCDQVEPIFSNERFSQIKHLQEEILDFLHLEYRYRLLREESLRPETYEDRIDIFLALLFEWNQSILHFLCSPFIKELSLNNEPLYQIIENFCNVTLKKIYYVRLSVGTALRNIERTNPKDFPQLRTHIGLLKLGVSHLNFTKIPSQVRSLKETISATVDPEPLRTQIPIFSTEVKKLAEEMTCIDRKAREIYLRFCGLQLCCHPYSLQGSPLHGIHPSGLDIKEVGLYTAAYNFGQALYFARKTSGAIQEIETAAIQACLARSDFTEAMDLMEREDFGHKQDAQRLIFDAAFTVRRFDVLRQLRQHPLFDIQQTFQRNLEKALEDLQEDLAQQLVACDPSLQPVFDRAKKILRIKHCLFFLGFLPVGCIGLILGIVIRIFKLLIFYPFWRTRDELFYNWKARLIDSGRTILEILAMPVLVPIALLCVEVISLYGIFFPFHAEKFFSKILKSLQKKQLGNAQAERPEIAEE